MVIECDKRCYGCDYNKYNCTTCVGKYRVAPDCLCKTGTYELENEQDCLISCPDGTFADIINLKCFKCRENCKTCLETRTICSSCSSVRFLCNGVC